MLYCFNYIYCKMCLVSDTYERARHKMIEAEYTSDLQSQAEDPSDGRKLRQQKR